jgi:hypothetical protein
MEKPYKVIFRRSGRALVYEDADGILTFGYDIDGTKDPLTGELITKDPATGKNKLILEKMAGKGHGVYLNPMDDERTRLALDRTREYLIGCGFLVRVA